MMDYIIAIPSFKRVEIFRTKTLRILKDSNVNMENVFLFVENEEQKKLYEPLHNKIIVTDTVGIGAKRNYMRKWFRDTNQKYVFCIDDDINMIKNMRDELEDLDKFIRFAFEKTEELGLNIWGVCPFDNAFYMKETVSTNLKYICGALFGLIIDKNKPLLQTTYNHYEDFQFSIEHFKRDKGVCRFNYMCIKTKYFGDGGINESYGGMSNRQLDMEEAGKRFALEYQGYARLIRKKYGYDIRLNHCAKPP